MLGIPVFLGCNVSHTDTQCLSSLGCNVSHTDPKCLSFPGFALCHMHLSAPQVEGWSYNELNQNCLYADTETTENAFHYSYMLFVLSF